MDFQLSARVNVPGFDSLVQAVIVGRDGSVHAGHYFTLRWLNERGHVEERRVAQFELEFANPLPVAAIVRPAKLSPSVAAIARKTKARKRK